MIKITMVLLVILLFFLQAKLWFSEDGIPKMLATQKASQQQKAKNALLAERNAKLEQEVGALKAGKSGLEAHARKDLGMVKRGETYYHITDGPGA